MKLKDFLPIDSILCSLNKALSSIVSPLIEIKNSQPEWR